MFQHALLAEQRAGSMLKIAGSEDKVERASDSAIGTSSSNNSGCTATHDAANDIPPWIAKRLRHEEKDVVSSTINAAAQQNIDAVSVDRVTSSAFATARSSVQPHSPQSSIATTDSVNASIASIASIASVGVLSTAIGVAEVLLPPVSHAVADDIDTDESTPFPKVVSIAPGWARLGWTGLV